MEGRGRSPTMAQLRFSYYLRNDGSRRHRGADQVVIRRWLCSCGSGGYTLDATTFRDMVLSHLRAKHGSTTATVTADSQPCTDRLIAYIERKILG
jgi:hypothetical protein